MKIFSFLFVPMFLMDEKNDDKGGGGGGKDDKTDAGKELSDLKASHAKLLERLDAMEKKGKGKAKDEDDESDDDEGDGLGEKAKRAREAKEKTEAGTKQIESALKFSLGAPAWLKDNASLLPKDIEGIFTEAEKEKYESAIEKDGAIKSAVIQSFFKVQSNLDLLTDHQKIALEDFLKLTKNGKQEKAQGLYDQIFDPTFEMLKRIKKAEQLSKGGQSTPNDGEAAYRDRLMKLSRKHYLNEKEQ